MTRSLNNGLLSNDSPLRVGLFQLYVLFSHEDPEAMSQVKQWSRELNIPIETMLCQGCRSHNGQIPVQMYLYGESHRCAAYECAKSKGLHLCGDCEDFPCDHLHPYADKADSLPHNIKVSTCA